MCPKTVSFLGCHGKGLISWVSPPYQQNSKKETLNLATTEIDQSVENIHFLKGADERNEFFKKQTVMYDEQVRANKANDTISETN